MRSSNKGTPTNINEVHLLGRGATDNGLSDRTCKERKRRNRDCYEVNPVTLFHTPVTIPTKRARHKGSNRKGGTLLCSLSVATQQALLAMLV